MGPAGRSILEYLVLSGSLRPGFGVHDTGDGGGRPQTLYFVHTIRYLVCVLFGVLRKLFCVLRNVANLSRNGHIGFRQIWVQNDSAQSGKLDGWFAYLLCAQ